MVIRFMRRHAVKNTQFHALLRIVFISAMFCCLWLLASHRIFNLVGHELFPLTLNYFLEGCIFIIPVSIVVYLLLRQYTQQVSLAEMALRENEERYRTVVEDQTEVICRFEQDGTLTFVNDVCCSFFGKTRAELLGRKWHPNAYADDVPMVEEQLRLLSSTNPVVVIENRVYSGTGEIRWMEFVNRGFFDSGGQLTETQVVGRDITKRKEAENALLISDERLNLALAASKMGVWEWDLHTDTVYWSPECHAIVGLPDFNGAFATFAQLLHPADVARVMATVDRALAQREILYADAFRIIRPDGELRWLSNLGRVTYDQSGIALRLTGTVLDITERKRAEEMVFRYAKRLVEVEEELRKKIAIELHDEIAQNLAVLNINNVIISNQLPLAAREEFNRHIKSSESLIADISEKVRNIMVNLRPPVLDDYGLLAALQWQGEQLSKRTGLQISILAADSFPRLGMEKEIALFRIAQEAMTNTVKYAWARHIVVELSSQDGWLKLVVSDDGCGFAPESAAPVQVGSGWGLTIMRERAKLIGGTFDLYTRPGQGTIVTVEITPAAIGVEAAAGVSNDY